MLSQKGTTVLFSYDGVWWTDLSASFDDASTIRGWPCSCGASFDDRHYVSFYGGYSHCGCCSDDYNQSVTAAWGKEFSLEYLKRRCTTMSWRCCGDLGFVKF